MSFIDQLSVVGGNLALCVGMSFLSMFEVVVFIFIVVSGIIIDLKQSWKKMFSYFRLAPAETKKNNAILHKAKKTHYLPDPSYKEYEEDQLAIQKLYVSLICNVFESIP